MKRLTSRKTGLALVGVSIILLTAIFFVFRGKEAPVSPELSSFRKKFDLLRESSIVPSSKWIKLSGGNFVVFLSLCDSKERASVLSGIGSSSEQALNDLKTRAESFIQNRQYDPCWMKIDLPSELQEVSSAELSEILKSRLKWNFRYGIAFDKNFNTALLEQELNGNNLIDYWENKLIPEQINGYLLAMKRPPLGALPDRLTLFRCRSFFCDEQNTVLTLHANEADYGRRIVDPVDRSVSSELIERTGKYLLSQMRPNGSFFYGWHASTMQPITGYNILRHTGSIWSLLHYYQYTGDRTAITQIEKAIQYLLDNTVVKSDAQTAYIYEKETEEIKLGGLGLALIALSEYIQTFESEIGQIVDSPSGAPSSIDRKTLLAQCRTLLPQLGNGVLALQDRQKGTYFHVLNEDFSKKAEFRTVYYDGEATFGLLKLYAIDKDPKWLNAASAAVEHFIQGGYTRFRDQWVAYAVNEITKYRPEERFFAFGLKNAQENLAKIENLATMTPTALELLGSTLELYDRMKRANINSDYLLVFNLKYFLKTLNYRATYMLNGYFWPELAMYMKSPGEILWSQTVRQEYFQIRIDDTQHTLSGYFWFDKYFDLQQEYGTKFAEPSDNIKKKNRTQELMKEHFEQTN